MTLLLLWTHFPRSTVIFCFSRAYSAALFEMPCSFLKVESGTRVFGSPLLFAFLFAGFLTTVLVGVVFGAVGMTAFACSLGGDTVRSDFHQVMQVMLEIGNGCNGRS